MCDFKDAPNSILCFSKSIYWFYFIPHFQVSHQFPLNFNPSNPYCAGIENDKCYIVKCKTVPTMLNPDLCIG